MARYELLERIGVGSIAEVFRGKATAQGGFEKPVAIKRILPHLARDTRFVNVLVNEANMLAQLRHRNIVQVHDVGVGPDGEYFLVMEYVDGMDLGVLYQSLEKKHQRMPLRLAVHICAEVSDALDYAHNTVGSDGAPIHLVHRDVSPANVLLSRSGEVKLTDFGIAKRRQDVTHGGVRGKFAYIAPEQAQRGAISARSDVYSLGVIFYELALGRRLFSHLVDTEALSAVERGRIPRPSEVDPACDEMLEQVLLKALAHDPSRRFRSAAQFGAKLRDFRYRNLSGVGDPTPDIAKLVRSIKPASHRDFDESDGVGIKTATGLVITDFRLMAVDRFGVSQNSTPASLRDESPAPSEIQTGAEDLAEIEMDPMFQPQRIDPMRRLSTEVDRVLDSLSDEPGPTIDDVLNSFADEDSEQQSETEATRAPQQNARRDDEETQQFQFDVFRHGPWIAFGAAIVAGAILLALFWFRH